MGIQKLDLKGHTYGRLTVREYAGKNKQKANIWLCDCECGNTKIVTSNKLRCKTGTKSCGCLQRDRTIETHTTHGDFNVKSKYRRLYVCFHDMHDRCENKNDLNYHNYGGRGITVCSDWNKYPEFKEWALLNGYQDNLTIDRINVNGNYEPSNCRWVDMITQANNTRVNHTLTFENETHTITEWSRITGIPRTTINHRLKLNWKIKDVLTKETIHEICQLTFNNETHTIAEWSQITGIKQAMLRRRLKANWEIKDILTKEAIREICQLTFNNETHTIVEWSRITGIKPTTLLRRLELNWEIKDVLTKDVKNKICHYITFNNETHTVPEWSQITGINQVKLRRRLKANWEIKDILTKDIKHPLNNK